MPDFGAFRIDSYPHFRVKQIPDSVFTNDYKILLQQLSIARRESGLTQDQIAHKMRVGRSMIGKIERGERRLDVIELRQYCEAMGIPLILFIHRLEAAIISNSVLIGVDK